MAATKEEIPFTAKWLRFFEKSFPLSCNTLAHSGGLSCHFVFTEIGAILRRSKAYIDVKAVCPVNNLINFRLVLFIVGADIFHILFQKPSPTHKLLFCHAAHRFPVVPNPPRSALPREVTASQ